MPVEPPATETVQVVLPTVPGSSPTVEIIIPTASNTGIPENTATSQPATPSPTVEGIVTPVNLPVGSHGASPGVIYMFLGKIVTQREVFNVLPNILSRKINKEAVRLGGFFLSFYREIKKLFLARKESLDEIDHQGG